jgi:2-C-methyl-D-erythritol 4-phosphate cytidylyltransferase
MVITTIIDRSKLYTARAPQCFYLDEIYNIYTKAQSEGVLDSIDTCTLASLYGITPHLLPGPIENIKITTPVDFYIAKALFDLRENETVMELR